MQVFVNLATFQFEVFDVLFDDLDFGMDPVKSSGVRLLLCYQPLDLPYLLLLPLNEAILLISFAV